MDEFYVGWMDKAPRSHGKKVREAVIGLVFSVTVIAALVVWNQRPFVASTFEFTQLRTLEGILVTEPIPCLKIPLGTDATGAPQFQRVLLIGFGKKGAGPDLAAMEKAQGQRLTGKGLRLEGKLIYFDGVLAMELSEGAQAFKGFSKLEDAPAIPQDLGLATLRGEILDPKCYLGVMNPGEGKPHRSCAIRCIEGGIPPFFKVETADHARQYFFILNENGHPINDKVARYVADEVQLCGHAEQWDNWFVLKMDFQQGFQRLMPYWAKGQDIPMCSGMPK